MNRSSQNGCKKAAKAMAVVREYVYCDYKISESKRTIDRQRIYLLFMEFLGTLYVSDGFIYIPTRFYIKYKFQTERMVW